MLQQGFLNFYGLDSFNLRQLCDQLLLMNISHWNYFVFPTNKDIIIIIKYNVRVGYSVHIK
jgi:hypothetical protein